LRLKLPLIKIKKVFFNSYNIDKEGFELIYKFIWSISKAI